MILVLIILGLCVLSWLIVCGIIKLISICFGLGFSWAVATGIWLTACLINLLFGKGKEDK